MVITRRTRYWICQIIGWGGWSLFQLFIALQFAPTMYLSPAVKKNLFLFGLFTELVAVILATHLLRSILKKINWLSFSLEKVILMFFLGIFFTTVLTFYGAKILSQLPGTTFKMYERNENKNKAILLEKELKVSGTDYYLYEEQGKLDSTKYVAVLKIKSATSWHRDTNNEWKYEARKGEDFGDLFTISFLVSLWLLIYLVWHYVNKNRNVELDKLRLEGMVKSLELKTIKSHINPHFIFNALNSIRALVDENPQRARTAITELSNILRSSLQAEKQDTVPLKQELNIVNDYLALEQMRFEERLRIEMNIDPDTLNQPIPPMMLQTLVENGIKHGISKDVNGGVIKISSYFKDNHHELIVQNTGNLYELKQRASDGFGIASTQDRLNLLYNKKANFEIKEMPNNMVQSKITMPVADIL